MPVSSTTTAIMPNQIRSQFRPLAIGTTSEMVRTSMAILSSNVLKIYMPR